MKKIAIAIIIGISVLIYLSIPKINKKNIEVIGIIESTEVNLSSNISGKIMEMRYKEGNLLKKGDIVIRIDNAELIAQQKESEAGLQNAIASLRNAEAMVETSKSNIMIYKAIIEKTNISIDESKKDFERGNTLLKEGFISLQEHDTLNSNLKKEEAQLLTDSAGIEFAEKQYHASITQVESAKSNINKARANMELINVRLDDTTISSPIPGVITKKYFEEGENVSPGIPIITVVDDSYLWARIDLEESLINKVKIGDEAKIRSAFSEGREYTGKVIEIGSEGIFATQRDAKRGKQDIKTFHVKVEVINNDGGLKNGMTADVILPDYSK